MLLRGLKRSIGLLCAYRPRLVFCTGGYASGPIGLVAWLMGVPLVLHEQNSYPGVTVRVLSRAAVQVHLAFSGAARWLGGRCRRVTGNPTREGWQRIPRDSARECFGLSPGRPPLVVVGGSQGARAINQALAAALPHLLARNLQILWQTGRLDHDMACDATASHRDRVAVVEFIEDMVAAYSAADIALTRAGGMTLAELTRMGVPAVLVPLPTAAENHQERNARTLVNAGAARMIRQADLNGPVLLRTLAELLDDASATAVMADRSRSLGAPEAADRIVDGLEAGGLLRPCLSS